MDPLPIAHNGWGAQLKNLQCLQLLVSINTTIYEAQRLRASWQPTITHLTPSCQSRYLSGSSALLALHCSNSAPNLAET